MSPPCSTWWCLYRTPKIQKLLQDVLKGETLHTKEKKHAVMFFDLINAPGQHLKKLVLAL